MRVYRVASHPSTPEVLYVATSLGLFHSADAGRSWERFGRGIPYSPVMEIVISDSNPQHILVGGASGIFESHDGGNGFTRTGATDMLIDFPVHALAVTPWEGPKAILAASRNNGIFRNPVSPDLSLE